MSTQLTSPFASHQAEFDRYLLKFERLLPAWACRAMHWLRQPSSFYARIIVSVLLILGGIFSFLPVLGIWMLPLGLIFIAQDIPPLQPPLIKSLKWFEAKHEKHLRTKRVEDTRTDIKRKQVHPSSCPVKASPRKV